MKKGGPRNLDRTWTKNCYFLKRLNFERQRLVLRGCYFCYTSPFYHTFHAALVSRWANEHLAWKCLQIHCCKVCFRTTFRHFPLSWDNFSFSASDDIVARSNGVRGIPKFSGWENVALTSSNDHMAPRGRNWYKVRKERKKERNKEGRKKERKVCNRAHFAFVTLNIAVDNIQHATHRPSVY